MSTPGTPETNPPLGEATSVAGHPPPGRELPGEYPPSRTPDAVISRRCRTPAFDELSRRDYSGGRSQALPSPRNAQALLVDANQNAIPTSTAAWTNAGVTENLTGAAGAVINTPATQNGSASSPTVQFTDNLTVTGTWNSTFPGTQNPGTVGYTNAMLNDYIVYDGNFNVSAPVVVTLGGFGSTITSTMPGVTGSFTLQPLTACKLYLFGAGDSNGQDTAFTFNPVTPGNVTGGVTRTTSPTVIGTENGHFVSYNFVTPADLTGYTIQFTYDNATNTRFSAWNGAAIVVPEPTTFAMLLGGVGMLVGFRRSRRS